MDAKLKSAALQRNHTPGEPLLGAGTTPLMRAARNGDYAAMRVLIAAGADASLAQPNGTTVLMLASGVGRGLGVFAKDFGTEADLLEGVKTVLAQKVNVNAANNNGLTALHYAAQGGLDLGGRGAGEGRRHARRQGQAGPHAGRRGARRRRPRPRRRPPAGSHRDRGPAQEAPRRTAVVGAAFRRLHLAPDRPSRGPSRRARARRAGDRCDGVRPLAARSRASRPAQTSLVPRAFSRSRVAMIGTARNSSRGGPS